MSLDFSPTCTIYLFYTQRPNLKYIIFLSIKTHQITSLCVLMPIIYPFLRNRTCNFLLSLCNINPASCEKTKFIEPLLASVLCSNITPESQTSISSWRACETSDSPRTWSSSCLSSCTIDIT